MPDLRIPAGEQPPWILTELLVATESRKEGTASGPDGSTADFLQAGGHELRVLLALRMTFYLQRKISQTSGGPRHGSPTQERRQKGYPKLPSNMLAKHSIPAVHEDYRAFRER